MVNYYWNFNPLEVVYNQDALQNVVKTVHWQYYATCSLDTGSLVETSIGVVSLSTPDSGSFIPFASITEDIVTAWVTGSLGDERVTQMQTNMSTSIARKLTPVTGIVPPPWIAQ